MELEIVSQFHLISSFLEIKPHLLPSSIIYIYNFSAVATTANSTLGYPGPDSESVLYYFYDLGHR